MTDRIRICDLRADCIIGTEDRERVTRQRVLLNITLDCSLSQAAASDDLADTVNYVTLKNRILALLDASQFRLIERLADEVAALCLEDPRVRSATVRVDKPGALTGARSVAVEVTRTSPTNSK
jgi:FolB domain-containing protein